MKRIVDYVASSFQISNISNKICNSLFEGGKMLSGKYSGQVSLDSNTFLFKIFFFLYSVSACLVFPWIFFSLNKSL